MTALFEFEDAILPLNAAEAFAVASELETMTASLKNSEVRYLPSLLINFAVQSGQDMDSISVDRRKVEKALSVVANSSMLEAAEFTLLLKEKPEFNA